MTKLEPIVKQIRDRLSDARNKAASEVIFLVNLSDTVWRIRCYLVKITWNRNDNYLNV